jgi:hypothetical protein
MRSERSTRKLAAQTVPAATGLASSLEERRVPEWHCDNCDG